MMKSGTFSNSRYVIAMAVVAGYVVHVSELEI